MKYISEGQLPLRGRAILLGLLLTFPALLSQPSVEGEVAELGVFSANAPPVQHILFGM